jgi:hypothetical protein
MPESEDSTEKKQEQEKENETEKEKETKSETKENKDSEKVETFAKKVGIIEPPPEIKVVVDRTADFVRRVGSAFEAEIVQRNKKNEEVRFFKGR